MEEQAYAHGDAHDARGAYELAGGFGGNVVVVDDGERAYALEPCIHDEMGGVFAALGVGVVHVIVEHGLIPVFGHFQHEVTVQKPAYHGMTAAGCLTEVVGETELSFKIAVGPHEFLHELDQYAPRVDAQRRARHDEHFVAQCGEGFDSVVGLALGECVEQAQNGRGHAQLHGNGKFHDAGRTELRHEAGQSFLAFRHGLVDHGEKLVVLRIEAKGTVCHDGTCDIKNGLP